MKKILLLIAIAFTIASFVGCSQKEGAAPIVKLPGVSKTVATVDGLSITSKEYQTFLHENFGDKALEQLIQEKVLLKWAKDESAEPTKEQIDAIVSQLKEDGQYDMILANVTQEKLDKNIKDQAMIINISKKLTPIKDTEIEKLYKESKDKFVHPEQKYISITLLGKDKKAADADYAALKEIKDSKAYYGKIKELGKKNKEIQSIPPMELTNASQLPKEITDAAKSLKADEVSTVQIMKGNPKVPDSDIYFFLKLTVKPEANKSVKDAKPELENMIALTNLSKNDKFRTTLEKKVKDAVIDIKIKEYEDVAEKVKNPQPQMGGGMSPEGMQ